jgi:hypothetical protein
MTVSPFVATTLRMSSGFLIWAIHFLIIYGFTALVCERGFVTVSWFGIGVVPWIIGLATLIAVAATLALVLRARNDRRRRLNDTSDFVYWMTATLGGLALVAMLWEALPVLLVPTCG